MVGCGQAGGRGKGKERELPAIVGSSRLSIVTAQTFPCLQSLLPRFESYRCSLITADMFDFQSTDIMIRSNEVQ